MSPGAESVVTVPSLAEAAREMAGSGEGTHLFAGGTLLMRALNEADPSVRRLVRVTDPALREIRTEGRRLVLGAFATMADVIAHPDCGALAPVARAVGGPQVRNAATVGGNLFAPHPYGDFATALLALDATARLADGSEQPVEALLADRPRARPVAAVAFDRPDPSAFRFAKLSRVKPKGVAVLSLAAHLPQQGGRLAGVRLAWGAMGPTPLRATSTERALEGKTLDTAGIADALRLATDGLDPADDALASAWYRREVAPVQLRRLLLGETGR